MQYKFNQYYRRVQLLNFSFQNKQDNPTMIFIQICPRFDFFLIFWNFYFFFIFWIFYKF